MPDTKTIKWARQRAEFESAGFNDFDAKLEAWLFAENGGAWQLYFRAPDVCTAYWNTQSWLRHVDWTFPANSKALSAAKNRLAEFDLHGIGSKPLSY